MHAALAPVLALAALGLALGGDRDSTSAGTIRVSTQASASASDPFPAANEPLAIPGPQDAAWKMKDLLDEYGRITDQTIVYGAETAQLLAHARVGVNAGLEAPASEVHEVVEALMIEHGFVFTWSRTEAPRMLGVAHLHGSDQQTLRAHAVFVPEPELARWASHPARLVHTTLTLAVTDVRMLANTLRALLTDANVQQIVPVGNTNTVMLTGFGGQVHDLARALRRIDDENRKALESK